MASFPSEQSSSCGFPTSVRNDLGNTYAAKKFMKETFMKENFSSTICMVFFSILNISILTGCSNNKKNSSRGPIKVETLTVGDNTYGESHDYVGTIEEKTGSVLSFEVAGNITSFRVDEGDRVCRGQTLATIDPVSIKEAHRATLTTLKQAQDAYNRFLPLHKSGTISDMRWVDIESKLEQAKAAENIARQQLSHTALIAPYSGVIASKNAEMGTYVLPGQPILKLANVAQVYVKISVPESEISHIHIGNKASISVAARGGVIFNGNITEKGIDANPISHTYDVKVLITNSQGKLLPGMVCNTKVFTSEHNTARLTRNATQIDSNDTPYIVIPANCIELEVDNSRFVWTVVDGKAHQQPVRVGEFKGEGITILSGIKPGDKVIVNGQQKVSEGMKIEIKK